MGHFRQPCFRYDSPLKAIREDRLQDTAAAAKALLEGLGGSPGLGNDRPSSPAEARAREESWRELDSQGFRCVDAHAHKVSPNLTAVSSRQ